MKKVFLIAAMIVATLSVNAQAEPGSLTIQPHVGGSAGMITHADKAPSEFKLENLERDANGGGIIGVELEYQVAKHLGIAAGANFMQAGTAWKEVTKDNSTFKDLKVETSYLTVPVVANIYLCKGLALKSGVQFGFLMDAKMKNTREWKDVDNTNHKDELSKSCKDMFNKFDVAIPVGISYEFKVPIVIDLRYNIGLSKVNKDNWYENKSCQSHTCTLTVGYKFKL